MIKKILVIEDDNILQQAVGVALTDAGFQVVKAMDGSSGLKMVKTEKPDLVLLDIILPEKDGIDVLKSIRQNKETAKTLVMVFTAYKSEDLLKKCLELGVQGYFYKTSYSLEEIVAEIKKIL